MGEQLVDRRAEVGGVRAEQLADDTREAKPIVVVPDQGKRAYSVHDWAQVVVVGAE